MEEIIKFLNENYKKALKLVDDFNITKSKKWDSQTYLNELYVQVGHVYNVLYSIDSTKEDKRIINNLGDELSDVILQLINLANNLGINMYEIKDYSNYDCKDINGITILLGQLTEAIMEINDCRFKKNRFGFNNSYDFVKDRIFKIFIITFQIAKQYNLNLSKEFKSMLTDANGFIKRFKKGKSQKVEYIDIYDSKENLLGYCEKSMAHQLGYWHKVFGCFIINSKKDKIFFQLKNPAYNHINTKELLEITAGGHLISGETLKNGIREIKEETGLNVSYNDLIFIEKRKCNKTIKKDYIIREFQYYYLLDLKNISLLDFKNYDKNEVITFVELNINDVIKLLDKKKKYIKGKKIVNNKIVKVKINMDNFDPAFIKDGLFKDLIFKIKTNFLNTPIEKKLNKLYKITHKVKKTNPEKFFFDNGKVCNTKEFIKSNIKFSVMKIQPYIYKDSFITCLRINYNHKSIPLQLPIYSESTTNAKHNFDSLCDYIDNTSASEIINNCFDQNTKDLNKRKSKKDKK